MTTTTNLKERLQTIAQMNFSVPRDIEPLPLALEMIDQIGSPDKELRDDLIYTALATWILEHHIFDSNQLRQLLLIALDDQHLFYCIGETNTDSVFTRSFSVLLIPLILIAHRERPFLNKSEIHQVKEALLEYLKKEKDLRGYVEGKGWAHAVAHVGDAIDDLAQCPEIESTELQEILNSISAKMCFDGAPYVHEEDERMTTAVISVLNRQLLDDTDIENWIRQLVARTQEIKRFPTSSMHFNVKNFLRSLYFRMRQKNMKERLLQTMIEALYEISHYKD